MYKRLFTAAIIFGAAALAPPALAQGPATCLERAKLTEVLQGTYHEIPRGAGLLSPVQMFEIWTSPATGSFTVLITRPDGVACIIAAGRLWQDAPQPPPGATAG